MSLLRGALMSVFVLGLAISPFLAHAVGATTAGPIAGARQLFVSAANGNGGGGNDNNNNGGNDNNSNSSNDNNSNNSNGNNGNDSTKSSGPAPSSGAGSNCAQAGHDTTIVSADGRVAVHIFPSMARNVRITIVMPIDPATVPATPGQKVDALLFQLTADDCAGGSISPLPAEVNLGVRYTDQDATGLTESKFSIVHLDPVGNTWKPELKQAADPNANFVSATITATGFYAVEQAP